MQTRRLREQPYDQSLGAWNNLARLGGEGGGRSTWMWPLYRHLYPFQTPVCLTGPWCTAPLSPWLQWGCTWQRWCWGRAWWSTARLSVCMRPSWSTTYRWCSCPPTCAMRYGTRRVGYRKGRCLSESQDTEAEVLIPEGEGFKWVTRYQKWSVDTGRGGV